MALRARYGETACLYAGGTELLLTMKEGLLRYERLINIKLIPDLAGIALADGALHIGAITTHRTLERSAVVRAHFPTVAEMAAHVANVRVREVGTLGGNLCFAEPHADPGTLLLVYDASVALAQQGGTHAGARAVSSWGRSRWRWQTTRSSPPSGCQRCQHTAAAYLKYGLLERPSVGVAVAVTALPDQVQEVRMAVGCVGPTPRRLRDVEGLLSQKELPEVRATLDAAGALAGSAADAVTDLHGSAEYKTYLVGVLLRRAFERAYQQAIGGDAGDAARGRGTA